MSLTSDYVAEVPIESVTIGDFVISESTPPREGLASRRDEMRAPHSTAECTHSTRSPTIRVTFRP